MKSSGTCMTCGTSKSKGSMIRHLATCLEKVEPAASQPVLQLRVDAPGAPMYWLDIDVKVESSLLSLDRFLRAIWLECCGHLSAFTIRGTRYAVMPDDEFGADEKTMNAKIDRAVGRLDTPFSYEYDYGSTTGLRLRVTARRSAAPRREVVRLLARNVPPEWPCSECEKPASAICAFCVWEGGAFACDEHGEVHSCGESEGWLPVVNSPRMGVCGYTG